MKHCYKNLILIDVGENYSSDVLQILKERNNQVNYGILSGCNVCEYDCTYLCYVYRHCVTGRKLQLFIAIFLRRASCPLCRSQYMDLIHVILLPAVERADSDAIPTQRSPRRRRGVDRLMYRWEVCVVCGKVFQTNNNIVVCESCLHRLQN